MPSFFLGGQSILPEEKNRSGAKLGGKSRELIGSSGGEKCLWCWRAQFRSNFEKFFSGHFVSNGRYQRTVERTMQGEERDYKVYKHTFPNGKVYIGITRLKTWQRWSGGHGYKNQPLMWKAIQKYGWKNIKHEVICANLTKAEAEAMEIETIRAYSANKRRYGYNIDNGGMCAGRISEERKKKMSESMSGEGNPFYGRQLSDDHKQKIRETRKEMNIQPVNKRPVRCLETGIIYESTAEATRLLGIHNYAIRRVCYGERKTAGGYRWEYVTA